MFATSTRQPRARAEPVAEHAAHAARAAHRCASRASAVRARRAMTRSRAARTRRSSRSRAPVACGSACAASNHSWPLAGVVERQVADQPDPAGLGGARERRERLVAPEQRIDAVEARRVVAVGGAGREDRCQVDDVRAERLDVVEVLLDPCQVAAVPLARASPARGRSAARSRRAGLPSRAASTCRARGAKRSGKIS